MTDTTRQQPTQVLLEQLHQTRAAIMERGITDPAHMLVMRFDTILHILLDRGLSYEEITS